MQKANMQINKMVKPMKTQKEAKLKLNKQVQIIKAFVKSEHLGKTEIEENVYKTKEGDWQASVRLIIPRRFLMRQEVIRISELTDFNSMDITEELKFKIYFISSEVD